MLRFLTEFRLWFLCSIRAMVAMSFVSHCSWQLGQTRIRSLIQFMCFFHRNIHIYYIICIPKCINWIQFRSGLLRLCKYTFLTSSNHKFLFFKGPCNLKLDIVTWCHMRIGLRGVFGNAHLKTSMKRKPMGYGLRWFSSWKWQLWKSPTSYSCCGLVHLSSSHNWTYPLVNIQKAMENGNW